MSYDREQMERMMRMEAQNVALRQELKREQDQGFLLTIVMLILCIFGGHHSS